MSMQHQPAGTPVPELSELGKRIEMLRITRGVSKQHLARRAGTSRQQLWRLLSGKAELGPSLRLRLAEALGVAPEELSAGSRLAVPAAPMSLAEYIETPGAIERTLATMPAGETGRALKRRLLDDLEDCALSRGLPLHAGFFDVRRRVLSDEL